MQRRKVVVSYRPIWKLFTFILFCLLAFYLTRYFTSIPVGKSHTYLNYEVLSSNCANRSLVYAVPPRPSPVCDQKLRPKIVSASCEIMKHVQRPPIKLPKTRQSYSRSAFARLCKTKVHEIDCATLHQSPSPFPCSSSFSIRAFRYETQSHCLLHLARNQSELESTSNSKVPPIAHLFWYKRKDVAFTFQNYLSLLSFMRFFQPRVIFLWHEGNLPTGPWWYEFINQLNQPDEYIEYTISKWRNAKGQHIPRRNVPLFDAHLYSVYRSRPARMYNRPTKTVQKALNTMQIEALLLFGGLYIDLQVVALRNMDLLKHHPVTLCDSSLLMAEPSAAYLFLLHNALRSSRTLEIDHQCATYKEQVTQPNVIHSIHVADVNLSTSWIMPLALTNPRGSALSHVDSLSDTAEIISWLGAFGRIIRNLYFGLCDSNCG